MVEALNARDWNSFTESFDESVIFAHPVFPEPQKGVAVIQGYFKQMVKAFNERLEKQRAFGNGDLYCVEWISSGTHTEPLELPGSPPIPATNKSFKINSVGVFKVENGKITEWHVYADRIAIFEQLGIKPS
jgi:hypothetical protein